MNTAAADNGIKTYKYRWVVLTVFVLITMVIEIQWLTFAPIAREAQVFYGTSPLMIDLLSIIFMGVFVIVCIPASYIIDTYGIRIGIGFGALLTGIFGLLKGFYADSYTMVLVSQIGLAIAQPFIINAATKVAAQWFPLEERATAVGIGTLAQFLGIIIVMILTPILITTEASGIYDIKGMVFIYGIVSAIGAVIFFLFIREQPPTPPSDETEVTRFKVFEGFRHILKQRDMLKVFILFFIGLGIFNAVSTCIDKLCEVRNLTIDQTGLVGGIMLITGVIGAIIIPPISDAKRKRKVFLVIGMAITAPGIIGLTIFSDYILLLVSSGILGFFLLGIGAPIGFQYSAEVSHPAPESTTQGLILFIGQLSGIIFIVGINVIGILPFMAVFSVLAVINIGITLLLKESPMISGQ